jgi:hypothetical protein
MDRLNALEAGADAKLVVVDSRGVLVGDAHVVNSSVTATIDLPGFPLFRVFVKEDSIIAGGGRLYYESSDCSGQPWTGSGDFPFPFPFYNRNDPSLPVHIPDMTTTPTLILVRSALDRDDGCISTTRTDLFRPAIPVFVLQEKFTPPFRVVTRGSL